MHLSTASKPELIPVCCHVVRSCLGSLCVERTQTRLDLERYVWSIPRKLIERDHVADRLHQRIVSRAPAVAAARKGVLHPSPEEIDDGP